MKKLLTIVLAAAMLISAAIPVFAAEADPEVPAATSGDKTLTGATAKGGWEITDDAITSTEGDSMFVFTNETLEAGKLTATITEDAENPTNNGLVFCVSGDTNTFWENEVDSYYFVCVHKHEGVMKVSLCKAGNGVGWTGGLGGRYVIPEEDISATGTYTVSAEWDCTGLIKVYLGDKLVIEHTENNPLQGTRFGLRAAQAGVSYTDIIAEPAEPAENAIKNGNAMAIPGTITVDGVIDDAWADAPVYVMENEVSDDSRGDAATRKESSTIKFRVMYSDTKVYMLVEAEDDVWATGDTGTNWRNDSLMIFVSENDTGRGSNGENRYCMVAFFENYNEAQAGCTGFFTRNNNGTNTKTKEHAVVKDGTKAVMELSFELNGETPVEGGMIAMDLQYNDQDLDPATAENQSRTIVWAWSCGASNGPNNTRSGRLGWGNVWFVAAPECEHEETELQNAKEATETEPGYTGDKVCKDCGETVEVGTDIPATGTDDGDDDGDETPDPVDPPATGDTMMIISALALIAVIGAVMIVRRRKVTE